MDVAVKASARKKWSVTDKKIEKLNVKGENAILSPISAKTSVV